MKPRDFRLLVAALSGGVLLWMLLRRRIESFHAIPDFVEERIVLPVSGRVREGLVSHQEQPADTDARMTRKVGRNRKISVGGKLYGPLPQELVGEQVEVEERDGQIVIWSNSTEIGAFEQQS